MVRTQLKLSPPISCVGGASAFAVAWCWKMDAKNVSVLPKKRGTLGYLSLNESLCPYLHGVQVSVQPSVPCVNSAREFSFHPGYYGQHLDLSVPERITY